MKGSLGIYFSFNFRITKELMDDAQQWAENLAREDKFTYRQNSQYGENLYCLWSSDRNARANAKVVIEYFVLHRITN